MLLQKVSSAMPDIYMLMQQYHESCAMLGMRESRIRQLESQKAIDAKRQDEHIEKLTNEIEQVLAKHATKVSKLETNISKLEGYQTDLHRSLAKETKSKDEAKISNETLRAELKEADFKHREEREEMAGSHSQEKNRLISDHAASQRALSDHAQAQARIAEANMNARVGEMIRIHEQERQDLQDRRARERRELEEGHANVRRELEDAIGAKVKIIDEERRDCTRMKQAWEKEHDQLSLRRDEERARHRKDLEDQKQVLTRSHQKERDEIMKSMEASHAGHQAKTQATIREQERALESQSRQCAEAQNTILRLQRDAETHKRYASDAQEAFRKLQKENTDVRSSLETAQSRHQQLVEQQDRTRKIHSDNDIQNRSRTTSLSRQRSDPQENMKLRRDLENERGRNEDACDTINKLRRDLEVLKGKKEQTPSSSQRRSLDESRRSPLMKTTSNESSTSQKHSAEGSAAAGKTKNVTWQS